MEYKVGDRVRIKSLYWYMKNKDVYGYIECGKSVMNFEKSQLCDKIVTISRINDVTNTYRIEEDNGFYLWTDEMIEGLVEDEVLDEYEEHTDRAFKGGYEKCKSDIELNGFQLPEGYIFKDEEGNVINATKIVLEKKTVEEKYNDVKIQIFGNVVILKGGINADNPTEYMNEVVDYVLKLLGKPKYNQFIEDYLDNPWVRILVFDFNSMEFNNSFDDVVTNFKQK